MLRLDTREVPVEIRPYQDRDQEQVVSLWDRCGLTRPWNDPVKDIRRKQAVQSDLFLVAIVGSRVLGSVMAGYEGHRGWINYLAVDPDHWRQGLGRRLMDEAEERLTCARMPQDKSSDSHRER